MEINAFNPNLSKDLREKDELFEQNLKSIKTEAKPNLKEGERMLLEKCHNTDIMAMLKKEFKENPINYDMSDCPYSL